MTVEPNILRRKKILISDDDQDDQFIFQTAIKEVDPNVELKFFLTSQELIQYLLEVSIQADEDQMPDFIIGDMKVPFFDLKDIAEIRTFKQFRKIPVIVFAEGYSDVTKSTALNIGAAGFYHKPNSLHLLKDIFSEILFKKEDKENIKTIETDFLEKEASDLEAAE